MPRFDLVFGTGGKHELAYPIGWIPSIGGPVIGPAVPRPGRADGTVGVPHVIGKPGSIGLAAQVRHLDGIGQGGTAGTAVGTRIRARTQQPLGFHPQRDEAIIEGIRRQPKPL